MIIKINMQSEVPIYLQLRNEIVKGIGRGEFEPGESGSSAIIRYYCYIPCTSTLLQATACHIFHTLYVLSFLICY